MDVFSVLKISLERCFHLTIIKGRFPSRVELGNTLSQSRLSLSSGQGEQGKKRMPSYHATNQSGLPLASKDVLA